MGGGRRSPEDRARHSRARRRGDRPPRRGRPAEVADPLTLPRVEPFGDCALVVEVDDLLGERALRRARALVRRLAAAPPDGITAVVPGFTGVTVHYLPHLVHAPRGTLPWRALTGALEALARDLDDDAEPPSREIEIPVCYEGPFAPDMDHVVAHTRLSREEVVARHSAPAYLVHMIGFLPGFAYLGGMDARLALPRRATPRTKIPAGSVGIGGSQTGVYPLASPGGWNLIGRTTTPLLDRAAGGRSLLQVGDRVRFRPVTAEEYTAAGGT